MYSTPSFFNFLNFKSNEPHLRDYNCMKAAKAYLEENLAEKDFFREAYTEDDLTEICYLLFQKSGGISSNDKKLLSEHLKQEPSMDTVSDFAKHFQEKIISEWCECVEGTDPVTEVLRESVKHVLEYENFYLPVAAASYGYGLDDTIMFSLSVNTTLTEWPGQLPSFDTMLNAFEITKNTEIIQCIESKIIEILKSIGTAFQYQSESKVDLDAFFVEMSDLVFNCFDKRTKELMEAVENSNYEYKNFYYWLLSDILYDALGIQQITCYYVNEALNGNTIAKAIEKNKEPFTRSMNENQQWFEERRKHENT